MSGEEAEVIAAELIRGAIRLKDSAAAASLESRGYGEKRAGKFHLTFTEMLYLTYLNQLTVDQDGRSLSFDELVSNVSLKDRHCWTRFLIYRDLKSRGYIVKDGFGFGVDFRVYERGDFGIKPAQMVVFALNEGAELSLGKFTQMVEQITRMGKEPVLAVIERRGEVIYYKLTRGRFRPSLEPHKDLQGD
jgi:tRNA-intron endonuclease